MKLIQYIKQWYSGKLIIDEFENVPHSNFFIFPLIYREYHWSAKLTRKLVEFYCTNWKWFWTTIIAVVGLFIIK